MLFDAYLMQPIEQRITWHVTRQWIFVWRDLQPRRVFVIQIEIFLHNFCLVFVQFHLSQTSGHRPFFAAFQLLGQCCPIQVHLNFRFQYFTRHFIAKRIQMGRWCFGHGETRQPYRMANLNWSTSSSNEHHSHTERVLNTTMLATIYYSICSRCNVIHFIWFVVRRLLSHKQSNVFPNQLNANLKRCACVCGG